MSIFEHVNLGIKADTQGELFFFIDEIADKAIINEILTNTLTYKGIDYKNELTLYRKAKSSKNTKTVKAIDDKMRYMYRVNGNDLEKIINDTNNPSLAELFGYTLTSNTKIVNKVPIEVLNDVTIGMILYILLAIEGAHGYIIECTQISETGGEDIITTRKVVSSHGSLDGFISGAKYRFRAQAVYSNNSVSEFTSSVELRIN